MPYILGGKASWWAYLRWKYSPYWRGYRKGLTSNQRAHEKYSRLQEYME